MTRVPRLRDDVSIERDGDDYSVRDAHASELFRLTEGGWFLLERMDGVADRGDVRAAWEAAAGSPISEDELDGWIAQLSEAGVLVEDSRAVAVLRYLAEQGVAFRGPLPDRRGADRDESGRRASDSAVAPWFDHAVYLLNEGRVAEALDVFVRMGDALPADVRLAELVGHLEFLNAQGDLPELLEDRRDVSWAAFDTALRRMLEQGACPACGERFEIDLGGCNRCWSCGAGFTSWALRATAEERRSR